MRLTDLQIARIKPPKKGQKTYFDELLPGFGIRVSQGGSKSFVVMYGTGRRLKTLGRYPKLSLRDARVAAKNVQSNIALLTPQSDFALNPIQFDEARRRFLEESATRNKQSTTQAYRWLLERHFHFEKKLTEITRIDIMRVLETLIHTPSERQHAYVAVRTMMNWCVRHGYRETSPVPQLRFRNSPRVRVLSDGEMRTIWQRADEIEYPYGRIIQLLMLTGQRRGEVAALRRNWIDGRFITLPASITKNKREHTFPIGPATASIIRDIPSKTDLLFPARGNEKSPFNGWSKSKRSIDSSIEIEPWTLHDLRRTYSSKMAELGVPIHVTEKLLNHVSGTVSGIAAVYNRYSYLDEMQKAVSKFENKIASII